MMKKTTRLQVRNFAQIENADLTFGDLTVLVGAQGTGKSLVLQWLKAAMDGHEIITALRESGSPPRDAKDAVDLMFGVGMGDAWGETSSVLLNGSKVDPTPKRLDKRGSTEASVFFIPAHRATLIADGWAMPFQRIDATTPVVARLFSQNLFTLFSERGGDQLFPRDRSLKRVYRDLLNDAVFHGGTVGLEQDEQHRKKLKLTHGNMQLPFMTWTAGQREFTPLLLGLLHLLTSRKRTKREEVEFVVIEEPEMGLHPQAITVFLLLVLDLLWRGYRVVLSTHSPHVLSSIWALKRLQDHNAKWTHVRDAFGAPKGVELRNVATEALTKSYFVHQLAFDSIGRVQSQDISSLDAESDDEAISGWGGLTSFSSHFGDAVRAAVNESVE